MIVLEDSNRIKNIENRFSSPIEDLLYQMHWVKDMKHRDIGEIINIPRVTVTKWFRRLRVPTQSCRRFTDKNLTSWLYKAGKLKKKLRYEGPDRRIQRTKVGLNVDFFKKWSAEMAYVLGYFAADGCMFVNPRGSRYISFSSTDREILEKIKRMLKSKHKIALRKRYNENWKDSYSIQIGSKEMYNDLIELRFKPNKEDRLKLPVVPKEYISHFIRGYFDGDGGISCGYFRRRDRHNNMTPYISTCFAHANLSFLKKVSNILRNNACMGKGYLDKKTKHLNYSKLDSKNLFYYMYKGASKAQYLERKYNRFQEAFKLMGAVV